MNWLFDDNDWTDIALKVIGVILTIITFRWLKNIFSGSDGKKGFSQQDLLKMTAFILFTWASVYLIVVEAHREDLSHQVYGEVYLFLVFGGLLFVPGYTFEGSNAYGMFDSRTGYYEILFNTPLDDGKTITFTHDYITSLLVRGGFIE